MEPKLAPRGEEKPKVERLGMMIPVKQATFQAETLWPGKHQDTSFNPQKHPKIKASWLDGRGLKMEWEDGSVYWVAHTNVKGFEPA